MISQAAQIATKGILNNSGIVIPVAGWLLLSIEIGTQRENVAPFFTAPDMIGYEREVRKNLEKQQKKNIIHFIKATILYKNEIYTKTVYSNNEIKASASNIDVEIQNDLPIIKITFPEDE